ncbi:MAG TPA: GNAT family N-acetyltransferase [Rudaea sp.]|nr:GNAT family N-acetyltransferase [Rudaea sp.]
MTIAIVPIDEAHVEGFHACLDAVAREKKFLAQIEAPPLERIRGFVRESVASDVAQFVALDGSRVVGWCDVFPAWAETVKHCGTLGMGLLPDYRGRGIGKDLLTACLAKARDNGITRVELEVRADNQRALNLYERMGFVREAVKRRGMRFDGVYFDSIQMSLIFDDRL